MSIKRSMSTRSLFAALLALILVLGIAACGDDDDNGGGGGGGGGNKIVSNPDNGKVSITVGSKNFTEEFILGEIYAQALEAAGYKVTKQLNLGSDQIAHKAVQDGEVDAYPEYTATALTSFFGLESQQVPKSAQAAYEEAKADFEKEGLTAFPPTPFADSNAVGTLKSTADKLGLTKVSDLEGQSEGLTLYGSPECRQRVDCLVGLKDVYGLQFKEFVPVDIGLRYTVLDKGQADLSILFTSDAQLSANKDKYVILEDDKKIFPPANVLFVVRQQTVDEAGPDLEKTVVLVQGGLTLRVMQELNARVDIDKQEPAEVAKQYLQEAGYIG